jgi:hypothetical protein
MREQQEFVDEEQSKVSRDGFVESLKICWYSR